MAKSALQYNLGNRSMRIGPSATAAAMTNGGSIPWATAALDGKIANILASNAPNSFKQQAGSKASGKKKSESWWEKALNTVSKPVTLVTAGLHQGFGGLKNVIEPGSYDDIGWEGFLKDMRRNVTPADLLNENALTQDWNPVAKAAVGFAASAGLDPLTYIGGAGVATKIGGARGAADLAFQASKAADAIGDVERATELASLGQKASKGLSTLSSAEKDAIVAMAAASEKFAGKVNQGDKLGGLMFNVPLTGKLGQKMGLVDEAVQIPLLKQGEVASFLPSKLREGEEALRSSKLGQAAASKFASEGRHALTDTLRRGAPEQARDAFLGKDALDMGEALGTQYTAHFGQLRQELEHTLSKAGVAGEDITAALGGDPNAAARIAQQVGDPNIVARLTEYNQGLATAANDLVGSDWLNVKDLHAPTQRSDELRAMLANGTDTYPPRGGINQPMGFEFQGHAPGDQFMGEILRHPTEDTLAAVKYAEDGTPLSITPVRTADDYDAAIANGAEILTVKPHEQGMDVKAQMEAIAQGQIGDDYVQMFNRDWYDNSKAQLSAMGKRVQSKAIEADLKASGVAIDSKVLKSKQALSDFMNGKSTVYVDAEQAQPIIEANQQRIAQLQELTAGSTKVDSKLQTELQYRTEADVLHQQANDFEAQYAQLDPKDPAQSELRSQAHVARLEARYNLDLAMLGGVDKFPESVNNAQFRDLFQTALQDGFRQIGMNAQAPDHIVDAISQFTKLQDPKEVGRFLKTFDYLTSVFKTYAIMSPGFHMRNYFGGTFNNFLAGVDPTSYKAFFKADRLYTKLAEDGADLLGHSDALAAVAEKYGQKVADAYEVARNSHSFTMPGLSGSAGREAGVGEFSVGRGFEGLTKSDGARGVVIDNPLSRANLHTSELVERKLRGTLAFDVALKGGTSKDALAAVNKFHFNYADLSTFERDVMKRISPFYTWTRKNLPLQLEMMLQKPKAYSYYQSFKNNMEATSAEELITPAWFSEQGMIRMPFANPLGEQMYLGLDLPMSDVRGVSNPREMLGQLNPLIKLPVEMLGGRQLYNDVPFREGYVPIPNAWGAPILGPLLAAVGKAQQAEDGTWMTRDQNLYAIESFMPILGRARRLAPSEEKYQRRVWTSWATVFLGVGARANTQADQAGELYARTKSVDKVASDLNSLGYGGYVTKTKDIATTRKPTKDDKSPFLSVMAPKGGLPKDTPYVVDSRKKYAKNPTPMERALAALQEQNASDELMAVLQNLQGVKK